MKSIHCPGPNCQSPNPQERLAVFADVFSFGNPKSYKFETIFCSVSVTNPCRKMEGLRSERNLQMNGISNFQLRAGGNSGTSFCQIDRVPIKIRWHIPPCNTDPDTLMELKPGKAALRRKRHIFHCSHPVNQNRGRDHLDLKDGSV